MLTQYEVAEGVARITMDDGKVNALSVAMLTAIGDEFARAQADEAVNVVVLTGARHTFSAAFDLRTEPEGWRDMVGGGAKLAEQILTFPKPVVAACNGNAIAMGAFLLLSCDYRVGVAGEHRIGLNEVAIGLTLPWFGVALARHRLTAPAFDRCTITGAFLGPAEAREAGFLDAVVDADELEPHALATAAQLAGVNMTAHAATKLRAREHVLAGVRDGIERIASSDREW